ncbi:MAG TPA: murein biosynthesis integral membrane protein MurJ, partial [Chloroflexota bacterium]|nr:murein biosynthesis integral membrane protein MurJ [Chloroflexota bacterium]
MSSAEVAPKGKSLALGAAILMAGFVASRMLGLVRTMVISSQFGASREYEAYLAAIRVSDTLFQVLAGGAVASAFIPVFAGYLARKEPERAWRMASSLITVAAVVMTPISLLLMILAPQVMSIITPGWHGDEANQQLAANLARILLFSPVIFAVSTFVASILNSFNRFLLASLAPMMYNLSIIGGALLLGPRFGVYGLAVGAAVGALLHLLVQIPGLVRVKMDFHPMLDLAHEGVREVGRLMVPRTLGLGVVQVNYLVNVVLASRLEAGSLAYLDYAWMLTMLPLGVFAMAISTAVFPTLAEQSALDRLDDLRSTFTTALRLILYLTIPASVGLIMLGEPIVRLLLQRGDFSPEATRATAYALGFFAIGLAGQATVEIVDRVFYALHDTRTPVSVAFGAFLINVILSLVLMNYLSFGGLALANALAGLVEGGTLVMLLGRRLEGVRLSPL